MGPTILVAQLESRARRTVGLNLCDGMTPVIRAAAAALGCGVCSRLYQGLSCALSAYGQHVCVCCLFLCYSSRRLSLNDLMRCEPFRCLFVPPFWCVCP